MPEHSLATFSSVCESRPKRSEICNPEALSSTEIDDVFLDNIERWCKPFCRQRENPVRAVVDLPAALGDSNMRKEALLRVDRPADVAHSAVRVFQCVNRYWSSVRMIHAVVPRCRRR